MELSIITPVYNVEAYVSRCIDSVLNQTLSDFELILIDDGSDDQSGSICDNYAAKDSRIKVLHQENQGQAAARNAALKIAQGEYLAFVDSDDFIHPQMLEILLANAQKYHASISIGCCQTVASCIPFEPVRPGRVRSSSGPEFLHHTLLNNIKNKPWILCDKIFHRSCFLSVRMPTGRIYEDNSVVYRLLYEAETIADCDDILYYYYCRNESSTMNQRFKLKNLDWLKVLEEMILYFEEKQDDILVDKLNRSYLFSLTDLHGKVKKHLNEPTVLAELRAKLKKQYLHEKQRYPITIKTHPNVMEILRPGHAKCYWTIQGILSHFKK